MDAIVKMTGAREFQAMSFSARCVREGELGHRVAAVLGRQGIAARVAVKEGAIQIRARSGRSNGDELKKTIERLARAQEGVTEASVELVDDLFGAMAASMR